MGLIFMILAIVCFMFVASTLEIVFMSLGRAVLFLIVCLIISMFVLGIIAPSIIAILGIVGGLIALVIKLILMVISIIIVF